MYCKTNMIKKYQSWNENFKEKEKFKQVSFTNFLSSIVGD